MRGIQQVVERENLQTGSACSMKGDFSSKHILDCQKYLVTVLLLQC